MGNKFSDSTLIANTSANPVPMNVPVALTNPTYLGAVSQGLVAGAAIVKKFGHSENITSTESTVWTKGGLYTGFLTAAAVVRVAAGGNAADTAAGAGAQKVMIAGLDETWAEVQEEVTLAGTSASATTTTTFVRVFRAFVTDCGTYGAANTGVVDIETVAGDVMVEIDAGLGQTGVAVYTVPAGKTAWLIEARMGASERTQRQANFFMYQRQSADDVATPFSSRRLVGQYGGVGGMTQVTNSVLVSFPAKTDVWVNATRADNNNTQASVEMTFLLVDD